MMYTHDSGFSLCVQDLFPLGPDGKWVLIGSLYKTNQWWVGTLSGNPPRFTPENVGTNLLWFSPRSYFWIIWK